MGAAGAPSPAPPLTPAAAIFSRAFGFTRAYTDHRRMLEQEQLDTVFVVMHPQLQPSLAIEVMESGRNVYIEKPLSNTVERAVEALRAYKSSDRVVQFGTQQRSGAHFRGACVLHPRRQALGGPARRPTSDLRVPPWLGGER